MGHLSDEARITQHRQLRATRHHDSQKKGSACLDSRFPGSVVENRQREGGLRAFGHLSRRGLRDAGAGLRFQRAMGRRDRRGGRHPRTGMPASGDPGGRAGALGTDRFRRARPAHVQAGGRAGVQRQPADVPAQGPSARQVPRQLRLQEHGGRHCERSGICRRRSVGS